METTALRELVETARRTYYPNARPWPNGLGFEVQGWSFSYGEREQAWFCSKERRGRKVRGQGKTPFDAYVNATPVKEA